ncbi:MAG TPA: hypothetical protein VF057_10640 [Thermoanaerobaculia bacterium]
MIELGNALPRNQAIDDFVAREMSRGELMIGQPPALPDVAAISELLLNERIVWPRPGGIAEVGDSETSHRRGAQMTTARALVANALAKARANDAAGWNDLHAAWDLSRSLDAQPAMMEQTAALSISRMVNAVAWKMPLPAPEWITELQQRDHIEPLLAAFQHQSAAYWQDGARLFPTKWLADAVERDRQIAERVSTTTVCDASAAENVLGVDVTSVWRRAFRYRAEREATANALRVRDGKPIEEKSECSDGTWSFDGTTLRFSREIATPPPDRPMPLVLQLPKS